MKIKLVITVNRPIDVVFDQIADARNEEKWNTSLTDYKLISAGPIGKGSRFSYKNRGNAFASTLAEYDKPSYLAFHVHGEPMEIDARVDFKAIDPDTTTVSAEYAFKPKGLMKVLLPLFAPVLRKAFAKEFGNFKSFSETRK